MTTRRKLTEFTGTVTPALTPTVSTLPGLATPRLQVQETLIQLLSSLKDTQDQPLLTFDQVRQLDDLLLANGVKLLTLENRSFVFQIASQIYQWGFQAVYNPLAERRWTSQAEAFRALPGLEGSRQKAQIDTDIYRNKVIAAKGVFTCKKCGSEETISVQKQLRAADEPMTIFVTCVHCGNKWKQ